MNKVEELNSIEKYRQQQKQEKNRKRIIFALIILTLILIVVSVNSIFKRMSEDSKLPTYDAAELSKGFPITMPTSATYRLRLMDDDISLLTDTGLYVYDNKGDRILSFSHAYNSPVSETNETRTLIYDMGGTQFLCATRKGPVYENTVTDKIVLGKISEKGYVAIVVDSDRYASVLHIYNKNGKEIYSVSMTDKVIALDFLKDSSGCVVSTVLANNGEPQSNLVCYKFKNTESEEWKVELPKSVALEINAFSDDNVTAVCDNAIYTVKKGKLNKSIEYTNQVSGFCASDTLTAILLDDSENRQKRILVTDKDGDAFCDTSVGSNVTGVCAFDNEIYAFDENSICQYDKNGTAIKCKNLDAEYEYFTSNKKYFYLLSDTVIGRVKVNDLDKDNLEDTDTKVENKTDTQTKTETDTAVEEQ